MTDTSADDITPMTVDELAALGVSTNLRTAARALSIGHSHAYRLANNNEFPCPVIKVGGRWVVPTAGLRQLLGATQ